MEGAMMAPGNVPRLKSQRVTRKQQGSSSSVKKLLERNHSITNNHHHKNNNRNLTMARSNSLRNNGNHRLIVNNHNANNINKNFCSNGHVDNTDALLSYNSAANNHHHQQVVVCLAGDFTREIYNAVCPRLGHTLHIPEDSVQALFNEMHLYPSKNQVSEMLQCARQCGRRNGASKFITFGEFCVFVREMQQQQQNQQQNKHRKVQQQQQCKTKCGSCEVFLGGSCNPTTWRTDTAIPELQKHGITFYNPQVSMWAPELVALEHDAKQSASVLLFVVDSETRSTGGMIEAAYLVASGRCVVLVAHSYRPGQTIMGETITQREYEDLEEGQSTLLKLVKSRGIRVHTNLTSALQCTANILRNSTNSGISSEEQLTNKLRKLREVFDSYGGQDNGEIKFCDVLGAFEKLTNRELKINELYEYLNNTNNENVTNAGISFERFCVLMAEFTTDRCDNMCSTTTSTTTTNNTTSTSDGRFSNPLYWTCALLKTRHLLNSYVVRPVTNVLVWASQPFQRQCSTNNNNSCNIIDNSPLLLSSNNPADEIHTNHTNTTTTTIPIITNNKQQNKTTTSFDVFLGGPRESQMKWRRDVAIPVFKKHGITYYNPSLREATTTTTTTMDDVNNSSSYELLDNIEDTLNSNNVTDEDVLRWKQAMDRSKVLLFVMTNDSRSFTTMILAAHYIGLGRDVVLAVQQLPEENCVIANETLSKQAIKDYNRGRAYLTDFAIRKQVPVFEDITEAVECVVNMCQNR